MGSGDTFMIFVGYDTIDIRDIEKIHKYLIKRKS